MKLLTVVFVALLIGTLLPGAVGAASTEGSMLPQTSIKMSESSQQLNGGPNATRQIIDQMWVNVTDARTGAQMNKAALDKMIQYWRVRNWVPVYPIYVEPITGILSLLFVQYGIYSGTVFMGVLLSGTYWDDAGHCPRYVKNKKPLAGWYCINTVNAKVNGLARLTYGPGDGGYIETTWENVTAAGKKVLPPAKLAALKRAMKANGGWVAKGAPVWRGGKWLLQFTRIVNLIDGMTAPGVYFDPAGQCLRDAIYGKPLPGQTCKELGMSKPAGLASPNMGDGCVGVTEGVGVIRSIRKIVPGYSLLKIAVGGGIGYTTTMRGFTKDEKVLVNYIKCRIDGDVQIEIMYVLHYK